MITFKEISAYRAIKEVYGHKKSWEFLYNFIESSEEVEEDEVGNIYFVYWNDKDDSENYYTNENKYFWIAGYDGTHICFLQLMERMNSQRMELVIAQKRKTSRAQNLFGLLVDFIKSSERYEKIKRLSTFPMNDRLKEYYMLNGFHETGKTLKLNIR